MSARRISIAAAIALALVAADRASAISFTFAGQTFEQNSTPDVLGLLGNGQTLGGATFGAGLPTNITQSVGFIATSGSSGSGFVGAPGFNPALSLGRQANAQQGLTQPGGGTSVFSSAINMPNGNNGATTRHGLEVSWSAGQTLANLAGNDFVVYESGSNAISPEGFMVRARLSDGSFTNWYYRIFQGFQVYGNTPATVEGAFAHVYDLSDMGVAAGDQISAIQIANLMPGDRINTAGSFATSGFVVFNDTTGLLARPAARSAPQELYGSGEFDPDPLYVGIFNALGDAVQVVPEPASMSLLVIAGAALLRRRRALA